MSMDYLEMKKWEIKKKIQVSWMHFILGCVLNISHTLFIQPSKIQYANMWLIEILEWTSTAQPRLKLVKKGEKHNGFKEMIFMCV